MIIMTKKEFEDIYRQHYARMYRLARTMLYDADESKDVVSDVFAQLLESTGFLLRIYLSPSFCSPPQMFVTKGSHKAWGH